MSDTKAEKDSIMIPLVVGTLALALIAFGLYTLMGKKSNNKVKQPKISLMTPAAPPPPPPPPKFEKKIEPPKDVKEMKVDQQVQKEAPPAPSPELKMDGPAGDGPSAFASGKITSEDLSKIGTGKGPLGGSFNFNNYSMLLKTEMQRYLSKNNNLRRKNYKTEVRVWLGTDGSLKRYELVTGTGDDPTDEAIKEALASAPAFSEVPPANLPQPVRLRIVSTGRN